MESALDLWFVPFAAVVVALDFVLAENGVRKELARHGIRLTYATRRWFISHYYHSFFFQGIGAQGQPVSGKAAARHFGSTAILTYDHGHAPSSDEAIQPRNVGRDYEGQVQADKNRRLRELQQDGAAFEEHDLNGDGKVDDGEWAELSAKIEAEVRADLGPSDVGPNPADMGASAPSMRMGEAPEPLESGTAGGVRDALLFIIGSVAVVALVMVTGLGLMYRSQKADQLDAIRGRCQGDDSTECLAAMESSHDDCYQGSFGGITGYFGRQSMATPHSEKVRAYRQCMKETVDSLQTTK
jgi:hypothetical protein